MYTPRVEYLPPYMEFMETPPTLVPVINLGDLAPLIGDLDLLMGDLVPSAATFIDTLSFLPNWPFPPATGGRAKIILKQNCSTLMHER